MIVVVVDLVFDNYSVVNMIGNEILLFYCEIICFL